MARTPESVGMSTPRLDRIHRSMQAHVDSGRFVGISVGLARRGEVVFEAEYGQRDREASLPMTPDTIFRIYSMTKPVVSTALMLLFEESRLRLTDPVALYLPAFAATKVQAPDGTLVDQQRLMQVRDLLMHTSGLTYDFFADYPVAQQYRDARLMNDPTRSLAEVIDALAAIPLAFQPGSRWHYGLGIDVAARLVEVISGQSLGAFMQERLFDPLKMSDTAFGVPASKRNRLAAMYGHPDIFGPDETLMRIFTSDAMGAYARRDVDDTYPTDAPDTFVRGGIGLFSTRSDYMRFARMLANNGELDGARVMSCKTLELMHANHLAPELRPWELGGLPNPGWGFGLGSRVLMDVAEMAGAGSAGEFGWAGAAKTYYWVDPREQLTGVFMTQCMAGLEMPEQDLRTLAYQAIID